MEQGSGINFIRSNETTLKTILNMYRRVLLKETEQVKNILKSHPAADNNEEESIKKTLSLLENNPNLFNMNCEPGHFTGSALVVDATSGIVLLHLHKKLDKWLQFGGHAEYETNLFDVALRETQEETGLADLFNMAPDDQANRPIDIDAHLIPAGKGEPKHWHLDFRFVLGTNSLGKVSVDGTQESENFERFEFDRAIAFVGKIDQSLKRLIQKAKKICT